MKRRSIIIIVIAISFLFVLSAVLYINNFLDKRENVRNVAIQNNTIEQDTVNYKTIGLIAGNMQDESIANIFKALKDYSKDNKNVKMLLFDSEAKTDKQMLQLEDFISRKVDGIIMSPVENNFPESVSQKILSSGIPVVLVDSDLSNTLINCEVNASSTKIGEAQAEYMAGKLNGKGDVLVFTGSLADNSSVEKLAGFKKIIGKYSGIKITEMSYTVWDKEESLALLQDTLKKQNKIDGIVLQQNDLSVQIKPLLEKLNIKPYIIGVDTAPEVLEVLKEGGLDASIYIRSSDMAAGAYDTMMKIIKKENVPKIKIIPHTLITSENIDDYIENNLNYKIK